MDQQRWNRDSSMGKIVVDYKLLAQQFIPGEFLVLLVILMTFRSQKQVTDPVEYVIPRSPQEDRPDRRTFKTQSQKEGVMGNFSSKEDDHIKAVLSSIIYSQYQILLYTIMLEYLIHCVMQLLIHAFKHVFYQMFQYLQRMLCELRIDFH